MSKDTDILFGRLAVNNHMVTQDHINRCLQIQNEQDEQKVPLGQLLVEHNYLTIGQLHWLIENQTTLLNKPGPEAPRSPEEALFGKLAVSQNFISWDQLALCIREKSNLARLKINFRLGEIMIKKGFMTADQVKVILEAQKKRILVCEDCHCRFNIASFDSGQHLRCKFCGKPLAVPRDSDSVVVKETLRMPRLSTDSTRLPKSGRE